METVVLDVNPIAIVIKDQRGIIVGLNESTRRAFGDIIGHHSASVFHGDVAKAIEELDKLVIETRAPRVNYISPYTSPFSGRACWSRSDTYPLFDHSGNVAGTAAYAFDVTSEVTLSDNTHLFKLLISSCQLLRFVTKKIDTTQFDLASSSIFSTACANLELFNKLVANVVTRHSTLPVSLTPPAQYASESVSSTTSEHDSLDPTPRHIDSRNLSPSPPLLTEASKSSPPSVTSSRSPSTATSTSSSSSESKFYFGQEFLRVIAFYAELRETDPSLNLPVISLEVATETNFFCSGNALFVELLLRHLMEIAVLSAPRLVFIRATSAEGTLRIEIEWDAAISEKALPNLRACSELAKFTRCNFSASTVAKKSTVAMQVANSDDLVPIAATPLARNESPSLSMSPQSPGGSSGKRKLRD